MRTIRVYVNTYDEAREICDYIRPISSVSSPFEIKWLDGADPIKVFINYKKPTICIEIYKNLQNGQKTEKIIKPILEPKPGDKVLLHLGKGKLKPVTIIDGAYFRNSRVCNFWKWKDEETGEIKEGYGAFYKTEENVTKGETKTITMPDRKKVTEGVGQIEVTDSGIEKIIEAYSDGSYTSQVMMPKEVFIEAYEKYIKGGAKE